MQVDLSAFSRDLKNIIGYSEGFLEGAQKAKPQLATSIGEIIKERLEQFIDSNAKVAPQLLHHVYEWYQTGSPDARLFDITYNTDGNGLSISSTFSQSMSIKAGSKVPFYDKASIMESGTTVTITPRNKLVFDVDGKTVFTSKPVTVENPGGETQGEYEKIFNMFFDSYMTQSMFNESGIYSALELNDDFGKHFSSAKRGGRSLGVNTGYNWIARVGK
jgi:hypothetical protein